MRDLLQRACKPSTSPSCHETNISTLAAPRILTKVVLISSPLQLTDLHLPGNMSRSLVYLALLAPVTTFAATVLERTDGPDLPPANPIPSGWSYDGCFADSPSNRILNDAHMQDDTSLTGAECMAFCAQNGYPYAGTEYSSECYCGLTAPSGPVTGCNMGCTGNSSEACGGPGTITVYTNPALTPHVYPGDSCWINQGCYTDSPSARSLERRVSPPGPGVESCLAECTNEGFTWGGLEYGSECWCGNTLASTASLTLDGCDMTCQGEVDEYCGGAGSMNLYNNICNAAPTTTTTVCCEIFGFGS